MFPEKTEFVKKTYFVFKDTRMPYDRYWNKEHGTWGGLLQATKYTSEPDVQPEYGVFKKWDDVINGK